MTKKQLKDLRAMIQYMLGWPKTYTSSNILSSVIHDIDGILMKKECFIPRSYGFYNEIKEDKKHVK